MQTTQRLSSSKTARATTMASTRPMRPAFSATVSAVSTSAPAVVARRVSPAPASRVVVAAAAPAAAPAGAATGKTTKEWYSLVASAEFFFGNAQNECIAEQIRERVRFCKEQNTEHNIYFVCEPKWLEAKFPEAAKKCKRPAVAMVCDDKDWILFMKLRLDRVMRIDLGAMPESEVLAATAKIPEYPMSGKWTAPYSRYTPGWWEVFVPKQH